MELDKILCDSVNRIAIPSVLIDPYNWMKNDPIMGFFFNKWEIKNAWGWKWGNVYNTWI